MGLRLCRKEEEKEKRGRRRTKGKKRKEQKTYPVVKRNLCCRSVMKNKIENQPVKSGDWSHDFER